ncbi:MAG: sensor domain-containing diguanylate cyclase, partial [Chloroflexales bacterium]
FDLYHPDCLETAKQAMHEFMQTGTVHDAELQLCCRDGSRIDVSLNVSAVRDASGKIVQSRSSWRDITERKRLEHQLHQLAATDGLTGITNRRRFMEVAAGEIKRAARLKHPLALALVDLDHFKQINDTYGHAIGDEALKALTCICRRTIREIDVQARFGGDEFVVLFPETTLDAAHAIMERVRLAVSAQSVDVNSRQVALTISVGIASLASASTSLDALIEHADQALYQAKAAGRNRVVTEQHRADATSA